MSERKFWKSTFSGTIYEVVTEISDFVVVKHIGEDILWRNCIMMETDDGQFVPNPALEIKVGDYVRPKGTNYNWRKVLYIHQAPGDHRRFVVCAYEGDIPESYFIEDVRKKVD